MHRGLAKFLPLYLWGLHHINRREATNFASHLGNSLYVRVCMYISVTLRNPIIPVLRVNVISRAPV